jgi:hypothetical protein
MMQLVVDLIFAGIYSMNMEYQIFNIQKENNISEIFSLNIIMI